MKKIILSTIYFFALVNFISAQSHKYKVSIIGFYNLENLFDTINNPVKNDDEFTPAGDYHYNSRIYFDKLDRLASVISQMGIEINPDGLALMGCAEIENDTVLTDLLKRPALKDRHLKFVWYESPDVRGIDVGFIYNPKYFQVLDSKPLFVKLPGGSKDAFFTRDVLYVKGLLDGDTVHVFVNHWPSRSGGEERSIPARAAAASVDKRCLDSLMAIDPTSKVIIMGDLNDDPISPSITKVLKAKFKIENISSSDLYNPWFDFYRKGIGTLAYQDAWGLFDQIMMSGAWIKKDQKGYFYQKATIFNKEFLVQKTGKYRGYSKRTWDGTTYNYGYSDHFPVYITMLKRAD